MNKKEFKELDREQMIIAFNQLKDDYRSLFNELEQEKEINKEIAIKNHKIKEESNAYGEEIIRLDNQLKAKEQEIKYLKSQIPSDKVFYYSDKDYISKDKIKEKIEFYKEKCVSDSYNKGFHNTKVNVLEELLEGK